MPGTGILHLADLHLGCTHEYLGAQAAARKAEADQTLSRIVDFSLEEGAGIGGVVIAGDLFDRHDPPTALVEAVLEDLHRLTSAGIRLLTVPGNHDELSYPRGIYRTRAGAWPGTLVTQPAPVLVEQWDLAGHPIDLYAMAFVAGRSSPPFDQFEVSPGRGRRIAVLHGSLDAAWSDRSIPLRSSALQSIGLDYIALGHIHRPGEQRLGPGWVCYPGRIEGGGFDDPGGAELVLYDPGEDEPRPRRLPFPSRPIAEETWDLTGMDTRRELTDRFEEAADAARILRVHLTGHPPFAIELESLRDRFAGRFFALELIGPEATEIALESIESEPTIRGAFARQARRRIEAAADEEERATLRAALRHGLAAFTAEAGEEQG